MPDKQCKEACDDAYKNCVGNCNKVLIECLAEAGDDDAKKTQCKERFKKCMKLCRAAGQICNEVCDEN
jgi:hypothetical protein